MALVMVKPRFVHMDVAAILLSVFPKMFSFSGRSEGEGIHMVPSHYFALMLSFSGA